MFDMDQASVKQKHLAWEIPEEYRVPRVSRAPHAQLAPIVVRCYAGYSRIAQARERSTIFSATTAVQILVKLDNANRPRSFVIGPRVSPLSIDLSTSSEYLEVWLSPLGAYSIFGGATGYITTRAKTAVDLSDLVGSQGGELTDRIYGEKTWAGRFDMIEGLLLDRTECGPGVLPGVERAWSLLVDSGGTMPIGRIAEEVRWSHKHLIARFTQQVGLPPKSAARIIRFDRVRRRLRRHPHTPVHEIAVDCGYADQSHLNRDFRKFSGITPSEYSYISRARQAGNDTCIAGNVIPRGDEV
ncbi:helix-turn-helix transcriptional regulator [Nocardia sp. NPDC004168]|uniref:helix-turn-helix transcriptional regulator n=1 Tax=Nocardia sp. NPDC004168 TaxID=3154452 RepID=UPI0033A2C191